MHPMLLQPAAPFITFVKFMDVFNEEWLEDCESDEDGTQLTLTSRSTSTCPDSEEVCEVLFSYFMQNPL